MSLSSAAAAPRRGEASCWVLEERQRFSRSLLWELQRSYFAGMGVEAWRQGEVPHYVTSNPTVASCYADVVFAFLRDEERMAPSDGPLIVCELGAGSGRFAFHFLARLTRLCEQAGLSPTAFRYVLTDLAESHLEFWRGHPRFRPFFASGLLDMALFDVEESDRLDLRLAGETIHAGSLDRPLVVFANYLFDSIPQDLFYLNDGRCHDCLVSLVSDDDPRTLGVAELLASLQVLYETEPVTEPPYAEPELQGLLERYQRTLSDTFVLLPATGLRCLERLRRLSQRGLFVLSADKGDHRSSALVRASPPAITTHGSFSLSVSYHAFRTFCEQSGGVALFPTSRHHSINVSGLLMADAASAHAETLSAYERHVREFSPDDFYSITKHARRYIGEMTLEDLLAYLRLSLYDAHQFARYLPRLEELAPELDAGERESVREAIERVWELYFPIGEDLDLPHRIACLLFAMGYYSDALEYFERSIGIYGRYTGTLVNMAVCWHVLGRDGEAGALLREVLLHEPGNERARELLESFGGGSAVQSESLGTAELSRHA